MKKYGIYGTGYFGAELGRIVNQIEDAKVAVVYDPENGQKVADELRCDNASSLEMFFDSNDLDAIIVASPNYLHKEPVIEAAKRGVNVFCEKPIALSYDDCKEMVDICAENNVTFMAGHVMNFFNSVQRAKNLIKEGRIGEVLFSHSARNGWEPEQKEISWKKIREKSGGHLYHHIHELDVIQFIMGTPENVVMKGGNVAHTGESFGDEEDLLLITMEFPNNKFALLEYGGAFKKSEHYLLIQGTKGYIEIDMQEVKMTLSTDQGVEYFLVHETKEEDEDRRAIYNNSKMDGPIKYGSPSDKPPKWLQTIMLKEMEFFNDVLKGGEISEEFRPLMDGTAAMNSIATADACTLSLLEQRQVSLTEVY